MNMTRKKFWLLVFLIVLPAVPASAETLEQAWDIALAVDHNLKAAKESTAAALQKNEAAKAGILPKLTLDSGFTVLDDASAGISRRPASLRLKLTPGPPGDRVGGMKRANGETGPKIQIVA